MEYIIIGILILLLVLVVIILTKKNNNSELIEKITKLELEVVKELSDFKTDFSKSITDDFDKLNDKM